MTRLPTTGRYTVRVDEFGHWDGMAGMGDPMFTYLLHTVLFDGDSEDAVADPETGDDVASATPMRFLVRTLGGMPFDFGYVAGTLEDATDVDVYSFEITGATSSIPFAASLHLPGAAASGSTMRAGHLWITDAAGTEIIARTETGMADGLFRISPTLANGSYLLFVDGSGEAAESNDFYALSVTRSPMENQREADEAGNGTLAGAEALTLQPNGSRQVGFFLSMLPAGDVDYFSFTVPTGFVLSHLGCSSAWDGSGLQGLTVELRDSSDAVLASEVEDDVLPQQVSMDAADFGSLGPATYALRLSTTGQDAAVVGNWARCGVTLAP